MVAYISYRVKGRECLPGGRGLAGETADSVKVTPADGTVGAAWPGAITSVVKWLGVRFGSRRLGVISRFAQLEEEGRGFELGRV